MTTTMTYIGAVLIWLVLSVSAEPQGPVTMDECNFCRGAFKGCHCEGTIDDYKIVCNKNAHDFWSLSFCSAKSIKLTWDHPEQPEILTDFPVLPSLRDLHLVGLPDIGLRMDTLGPLDQLYVENPATKIFPVLTYPAKIQELKISSEQELWIPPQSFASLKTLSKLTLRGNGIRRFPIAALIKWLNSHRNEGITLECSIEDTSIKLVHRIRSRFTVHGNVDIEDLWWWTSLAWARIPFLKGFLKQQESFIQEDRSPISESGEGNLPVSFGVDGSLPLPDSNENESVQVVTNHTVSPALSNAMETSLHNENREVQAQIPFSGNVQELGMIQRDQGQEYHEIIQADADYSQAQVQMNAENMETTNDVQTSALCDETRPDPSQPDRNDDPTLQERSDNSGFMDRIQKFPTDPSDSKSFSDSASQAEPPSYQLPGEELPEASDTAFINFNTDKDVDLLADSQKAESCKDDSLGYFKNIERNIAVKSDYETSSSIPGKPDQDTDAQQASLKWPTSSTGSSNAPLIIMFTFGTCGFMLALVILCIRHRPKTKTSLIVPSSIDEDWIRTQTEPGSGD